MSVKTYKDHPIRATLNRMQELLDKEPFNAPDLSLDEEATFNRDKIQNVVKSLVSLLSQSPASLVAESALNIMNSNLQQPLGELTAFESTGNRGHLATAVSSIEQNVLNYTWAFLPSVTSQSKEEIANIIDSQQERSQEALASLVKQRNELTDQISALKESVAEQENRITELNEINSRIKAESGAAVANLEGLFSKSQTDRELKYEELIQTAKIALAKSQDDFAQSAVTTIDQLDGYKNDAARIVQVVGDIGVTGNYQNIANQESKNANIWRRVTVALFGCGIGLAALTFWRFYHEPVTSLNTAAIAIRLLYALAITAPAFYTARESARHRTNADRARQTELELASLGPFIELMKDADKEEIRKSLIDRYFGKSVEPHEIKAVLDADILRKILSAQS